jgi:hypothetical protein
VGDVTSNVSLIYYLNLRKKRDERIGIFCDCDSIFFYSPIEEGRKNERNRKE